MELKNKSILITGGTGSFGRAFVAKLLHSNTKIKKLIVFSRDELKQEDMRVALNNEKIKFYIGDVRNYNSVYEAMNGVDFVFHAVCLL